MEKENLPYRYLRSQKTKSSKILRKSLLIPLRKKQTQVKSLGKKESINSIMNKNACQYLHMLQNCHIKENYIKWAINLRNSSPQKNIQLKEHMTPNIYYKNTATYNIKKQMKKHKNGNFNTAQYMQFLSKNENYNQINESSLDYMISLRDYSDQNRDQEQKNKFVSISSKSKRSYPTFIKKEFIKKIKDLDQQQKQNGFDGMHKYPKYTQNILKNKNYGLLCAFTKGKNKTSLPTLAWQIGLRSY